MFFRTKKPHRIYRAAPVLGSSRTFRRRKSTITSNKNQGAKIPYKIIFLTLLTIGIIGTTVFYAGFSQYFKIAKIQIDYGEDQDAQEDLKKYFNPIIGKNIFFTDTDKIIEKIKKDYPDLEKLEVKKNLPSRIKIAFAKYPIVANITNIYKDGRSKYIVNEVGFSVAQETENQNIPYVRIFTEEPLQNTGVLVQKDKLKYILSAINYFEDKFGMEILDADYLMRARELHLRTERYFFVWLDSEKPYREQLLKLKKAVPKLDIYTLPLDYIDLRIGGLNGEKVIYKKTR